MPLHFWPPACRIVCKHARYLSDALSAPLVCHLLRHRDPSLRPLTSVSSFFQSCPPPPVVPGPPCDLRLPKFPSSNAESTCLAVPHPGPYILHASCERLRIHVCFAFGRSCGQGVARTKPGPPAQLLLQSTQGSSTKSTIGAPNTREMSLATSPRAKIDRHAWLPSQRPRHCRAKLKYLLCGSAYVAQSIGTTLGSENSSTLMVASQLRFYFLPLGPQRLHAWPLTRPSISGSIVMSYQR